MSVIELNGLKVTLGDPIQVAEGVGHCWFPQMEKFSTGELIASVSIHADAHGLSVHAQRIYISEDQGRTWQYRHTVTDAGLSVKVPRPNGDMLALPGRTAPDPPGQWRTFSGPYVRYRDGGNRIEIEAGGMRVEGLPRDIQSEEEHNVLPGDINHGVQVFDGEGLEVDGRLITTLYGTFDGDPGYSTICFESDDEGRTWRYLSVVAGPGILPDRGHGPGEANMCVLETGELMCVMRLGGGREFNLARSYSGDGGRSWSPVDWLPAFSVEPSLRRLSNGVLIITAGRPGIYAWLSTDPRGESWQEIDLVAHHNDWAPGPEYVIRPEKSGVRALRGARDQTTAYTELVEIEPNRLLMAYDRTPFGWQPVPLDSDERSRVFVMPIDVERT